MFQFITLAYLLVFILFFSFNSLALTAQKSSSNTTSKKLAAKVKPKLQLATIYKERSSIEHYWVSEKLDGVRGYWTGSQLLTRSGKILSPPPWFIKNWPNTAMDGELWSARGQFEQISSCVRTSMTDNKNTDESLKKQQCWKKLKLMIFDLPHQAGTFTERILLMQQLTVNTDLPYLSMIEQHKLPDSESLYSLLDHIVANNGEGVMLHLASATYINGRSKNLLKLKKYQDAEAVVIAHISGKGKYKDMLGAIKVKTPEGIIFKIGTGFSDLERQQPPKVDSIITYKYIGKTQRGVPKFASFIRIKTTH